jgi:hypothetical protein
MSFATARRRPATAMTDVASEGSIQRELDSGAPSWLLPLTHRLARQPSSPRGASSLVPATRS